MAERRFTFVTIEEVSNQVPEIDDGQDPLLILRQRKNEKGCHTRAVTKIRNHIAGHGSSHALQALHHNSQSLFLSAASFNNALLKMATTNDEYERYTDWGNKHLSSQVDIEGEIADYLQAISEEVEYVQHNQSQRTTTRHCTQRATIINLHRYFVFRIQMKHRLEGECLAIRIGRA